ncbi:MAG TPA: ATP-binding protein [Ktedonobacterales bacterium]|nr:ATP-binding protein [Ktedonobacterales bacterium]
MDYGALITAGIVLLGVLYAVVDASTEWEKPSYTPVRDWASEERTNLSEFHALNAIGLLLGGLWIFFAVGSDKQWYSVLIFTSLYSFGWAWVSVIAYARVVPHYKNLRTPHEEISRKRTRNLLIFIFVSIYGVMCLSAVIVSVFRSKLAIPWFSVSLGNMLLQVSAFTLLGTFGVLLSFIMLIRMYVFSTRAFGSLVIAIDKEGPSDETLEANIIQLINQGEEVDRNTFANVERFRLQGAFEKVAKHADNHAIFNRAKLTLVLRNAAAVRNMHLAFKAIRQAETDLERTDKCAALISAFSLELGLEDAIDAETNDTVFTTAKASPGPLAAVLPPRFPILVTALDEQATRQRPVLAALEQVLTHAASKGRFGIAIAVHGSSLLRDLLTRPDQGGLPQNVMYLDEDLIRTILATELPDVKSAFMAQARRSVDLSIVSPFITKGPTGGLMFVGRTRDIATILQDVETSSYAILGGRRIGKTSMLHQIRLRLEQRGYHVLFMDCSVADSYSAFVNLILFLWEKELGAGMGEFPSSLASDLPISFQRLVTGLASGNPRLVFVFDEIDLLLSADMRQQPPEQFFRGLRALSNAKQCQFIFSGERRIYEQFRDPSSPMFNFCIPIRPGLLTPDEARKLVEEPLALLNIGLATGANISSTIAAACSCHPNLLRLT